MLLGAVFDPSNDAAPGAAAHLERVEKLLADSMTAIDRSLAAGAFGRRTPSSSVAALGQDQ